MCLSLVVVRGQDNCCHDELEIDDEVRSINPSRNLGFNICGRPGAVMVSLLVVAAMFSMGLSVIYGLPLFMLEVATTAQSPYSAALLLLV